MGLQDFPEGQDSGLAHHIADVRSRKPFAFLGELWNVDGVIIFDFFEIIFNELGAVCFIRLIEIYFSVKASGTHNSFVELLFRHVGGAHDNDMPVLDLFKPVEFGEKLIDR